jgi:hypothetical protein
MALSEGRDDLWNFPLFDFLSINKCRKKFAYVREVDDFSNIFNYMLN